MREHEVPTHVQAEDRVLLWFTFPQVVAMTAVCALSYGAYRYAPVGPPEVRMALAVLLGLAGLVAVVGKIGGRRLPLVAADLLKYRLGARLYAGPPSELVRSEPPAPAQPVKSGPGPLRLMARRAGKTLRGLRRKRGSRERAFGGPEGGWLRFWGSASLDEGERIDYSLPLHGPNPSFTFSWEDTLGQAGAVTVEGGQIPYPLPAIDGELCDLRVVSLGWTPGEVRGVIESECVPRVEEAVELQTVAGHASVTETALIDSEVTAIAGTLTVAGSGSQSSASFVPGGETRFRLPVGAGEAVHTVSIKADLEASLSIPMPPLTRLTHHPARIEHVTKTVHLHRPGDSDSDSETATATCDDGSTSSATATAYAYVPSATIAKEVTVDVLHPEHVKAETVVRSPIAGSRDEALALASSVGADDPFKVLVLPEPEPEEPPAEQTPAGGDLSDWFDLLGWEWPW